MKKIGIKKLFAIIVACAVFAAVFTGCSTGSSGESGQTQLLGEITVVSREDGSGTRGAFTELMEIAVDDIDNTTEKAEISNSTSVVIQTVVGNTSAIGYISLGSLGDEVKAVKVDNVQPSVETVKAGDYAVARPFNIAVKNELSDIAQDFIKFILSAEGQQIIGEEGYIAVSDSAQAYTPSGVVGTVSLAGSTSVAPVMEVLADRYKELNSGTSVEIQQSGSSAGMTSVAQGVCDIGMASRELKDSELAEGLTPTVIAMDGIAVIVNKENPVDSLTSEQIKSIFTGEITDWSQV